MRRIQPVAHLATYLDQRLSSRERATIGTLREAAERAGSPLYLVGGSVRDLVLGRSHLDLDFAVETDARTVALEVARELSGEVVLHDTFRTATVRSGCLAFDLVTARREWYPAPGALPVVEPAGIADDLARRDFTINAMALRLDAAGGGRLIDPHGGARDLAGGILRVLHPRSFRDDPTRLWRAGRYLSRLRLMLDEETTACAERDAPHMQAISPARVHHELQRTLAERRPDAAFAALHRMGVLDATLAGWSCTAAEAAALRRAVALRAHFGEDALLGTLFAGCSDEQVAMAVERLALVRHQASALRALPRARMALRGLARAGASPSRAAAALDRFPPATLASLAARWPRSAGRLVVTYLGEWRTVRPWLNAEQVQALGVPFGPELGEALRRLRAARLDGETGNPHDEAVLVRRWLEAGQLRRPAHARDEEAV